MRDWQLLLASIGLASLVFVVQPAPGYRGQESTDRLQEEPLLSISEIQGAGQVSLFVDQIVRFVGVVTGALADQNASGIRFYTFFVQELPGHEDGNPLTSEGIAVFTGRNEASVTTGDVVTVRGKVTEFFGLTEIDSAGLEVEIIERQHVLPEYIVIDPPADNEAAASYLEPLEGMLVSVREATVVGPTHSACGFAVVAGTGGRPRSVRHSPLDPVGHIVNVLQSRDFNCSGFPQLNFGDRVGGLAGPLTYHFERYKLVLQDHEKIRIEPADWTEPESPPAVGPGQYALATFNLQNLFDNVDDTGESSEPKPTESEVAAKMAKLQYAISRNLGCPALVAVQEVEKATLLERLAAQLVEPCGFRYEVTHRESVDPRGIDVAMLSDPRVVRVVSDELKRGCSSVDTDVADPHIACPMGESPLFSRPPLQIELEIENVTVMVLVNHFKSKRGGERETEPQRLAQADHVLGLASELLQRKQNLRLAVVGDFNDLYASPTMTRLQAAGLRNAMELVPIEERYSYVFDGAAQLLDGILVSETLWEELEEAAILRGNADFAVGLADITSEPAMPFRSSDHDVPLIVFNLHKAREAVSLDTASPATPDHRPTREDESGRLSAGVRAAAVALLVVTAATLLTLRLRNRRVRRG